MRVSPSVAESTSEETKNGKISKWHVSKENLIANEHQHKPWTELTNLEKAKHVGSILFKVFILFLIIFGYICTFSLLSNAFKLIGGKGMGDTIKNSQFLQNPISASIIGMLISMILQNTSMLAGLLVGMVSGDLITVRLAIYVLFGNELGSSLMNVLVSMGHSTNPSQFRRAFACATLNDVYNVLNYLVALPLEVSFNFIERTSGLIVEPLSHIDSDGITRISAAIASKNQTAIAMTNRTTFVYRCIDLETGKIASNCEYDHLFVNSTLSDQTIGFILLIVSIGFLIGCLIGIVKVMQALVGGQIAMLVHKLVTYDFPRPFKFLTGYMLMLAGCLIVVVIESASVFRTVLVPLVGVGVVPLERFYCLIIGSNVGTTSTTLLAALASDPKQIHDTLQIALCQTLFNVLGLVLFYPIPCMRRIPLNISMKLGKHYCAVKLLLLIIVKNNCYRYRWFALVYTVFVFLFMPTSLFVLSLFPTAVMLIIVGFFVSLIVLILLINWLQMSFSHMLPETLKNWEFLPDWMHSLEPYDSFMNRLLSVFCCSKLFSDDKNQPVVTNGQTPL
ncbi:hypothetical protein M3Y97_00000500 [Aphelenchoides bicaudatus]|nr:hypothetical protein M3Y97_00000500 [Aphelenchoides bicaudatus]